MRGVININGVDQISHRIRPLRTRLIVQDVVVQDLHGMGPRYQVRSWNKDQKKRQGNDECFACEGVVPEASEGIHRFGPHITQRHNQLVTQDCCKIATCDWPYFVTQARWPGTRRPLQRKGQQTNHHTHQVNDQRQEQQPETQDGRQKIHRKKNKLPCIDYAGAEIARASIGLGDFCLCSRLDGSGFADSVARSGG